MENNRFYAADNIADYPGVSKSMAYKIVQRFNNKLKAKGHITISGKVSRMYSSRYSP